MIVKQLILNIPRTGFKLHFQKFILEQREIKTKAKMGMGFSRKRTPIMQGKWRYEKEISFFSLEDSMINDKVASA